MKQLSWELGLWATTMILSAIVARSVRSLGEPAVLAPTLGRVLTLRTNWAEVNDSVISAADYVAAHDPFRVDHTPSAVSYGSTAVTLTTSNKTPPPVLRGIVGEAGRWRAILSGVPGRAQDVLLQSGDTAGGLRIRRISADVVVIDSQDTTWAIRLVTPWP